MTAGALESGVLVIHHLNKSFPGTKALTDVDLVLRPGEVHALVGQNGSGKSTLIKILAGYHQPDRGSRAYLAGQEIPLGGRHTAETGQIRFVHQDLGLVETLSAVDNIALSAGYQTGRLFRIDWRRQRRLAIEALAALGYHFDVDEPVSSLRPAARTALAIARALVGIGGDARVLVLDEPTATMPKPEVEQFFQIIQRLRSQGLAVLYVTHHLSEVFEIANRVTVLRNGRNVLTNDVKSLSGRNLVQVMTGGWDDETSRAHTTDTFGSAVMTIEGLAGTTLRKFDLSVASGEVLGVAGIVGSGREELCDLIFGVLPREGRVTIDGTALVAGRPDRSIAAGVALVPSDRALAGVIASMTVRENLTLADIGRNWNGIRLNTAAEADEARDWVTRLGIVTPSVDQDIELLSGGNQQKVVVARCLRLRPSVLLLDQPTQGVDVRAKADIHTMIRRVASAGAAVVICSSDENELERVCDRVLVLRAGRIRSVLRPPDMIASRIVKESLRVGEELTGEVA